MKGQEQVHRFAQYNLRNLFGILEEQRTDDANAAILDDVVSKNLASLERSECFHALADEPLVFVTEGLDERLHERLEHLSLAFHELLQLDDNAGALFSH